MIVSCPYCRVRLRSHPTAYFGSAVICRCPKCSKKFKIKQLSPAVKVLIAHEDEWVYRQLSERLAWLNIQPDICRNSEECLDGLTPGNSALLLDVAFEGGFPFRLIETIKKRGTGQHKIILLPSVYNRTAYKKRPESLYGADAYLELHHIGDRLLPLLAEQFPALAGHCRAVAPLRSEGNERAVKLVEVAEQARELAKLLVADILLYHQDRLQAGRESGELAAAFREQLAEGRQMLSKRLPQVEERLAGDFIQQAFAAACEDYANL